MSLNVINNFDEHFYFQTQIILLFILVVALGNFVVGSIMGPSDSGDERSKGFLGYDCNAIIVMPSSSALSNTHTILN